MGGWVVGWLENWRVMGNDENSRLTGTPTTRADTSALSEEGGHVVSELASDLVNLPRQGYSDVEDEGDFWLILLHIITCMCDSDVYVIILT